VVSDPRQIGYGQGWTDPDNDGFVAYMNAAIQNGTTQEEDNCLASPRLDRSQRLALLAQAFRLVVRALRGR
jgi:hypothetical protein